MARTYFPILDHLGNPITDGTEDILDHHPAVTGTALVEAGGGSPATQGRGINQLWSTGWGSTTLDNDGGAHALMIALEIPTGLSDGAWGLYSNGGGTSGQGVFIQMASGTITVYAGHNWSGGDEGRLVSATITTGLHSIGVDWNATGTDSIQLYIDGSQVDTQVCGANLANGTGDPDIGGHVADYGGGTNPGNIDGSGIIISDFVEEGAVNGAWNTTDGNGQTQWQKFHKKLHDIPISGDTDSYDTWVTALAPNYALNWGTNDTQVNLGTSANSPTYGGTYADIDTPYRTNAATGAEPLSATGQKGAERTVSISSTGTVTTTPAKGAERTVSISGTGTITTEYVKPGEVSVQIDGTGTVNVSERSGRQDTGSVSGTGTVTVTYQTDEEHSGTAAVSSTGSITVTIQKGAEDSTSISGTGTVSANIQKEAQSPPVTISGASTITVQYSLIEARAGAATVTGTGTVTATYGPVGHSGVATTTGIGTVSATASPGLRQPGAVSGTGTVTVIGSMGALRTASVSGTGTVSYTADVFAPTHYWYPDVIISSVGLSGTVANIDEPVATPDDSWLVNG